MEPLVPLERAEQRAIMAMLGTVGFCLCTLDQRRATWQTPGLHDLYAVHPAAGLAVWFDAKRIRGGQVSEAQELFGEIHDAARTVALGRREALHGIPIVTIGSRYQAEELLLAHGLAERRGGLFLLRPQPSRLWERWNELQLKLRGAARQRRRRQRKTRED